MEMQGAFVTISCPIFWMVPVTTKILSLYSASAFTVFSLYAAHKSVAEIVISSGWLSGVKLLSSCVEMFDWCGLGLSFDELSEWLLKVSDRAASAATTLSLFPWRVLAIESGGLCRVWCVLTIYRKMRTRYFRIHDPYLVFWRYKNRNRTIYLFPFLK